MKLKRLVFTSFVLLSALQLQAQKKISGPLIHEYGETFTVPQPDLEVDTEAEYKVVFDIAQAPEDPAVLNPYFNTIARFLNMHAYAKVDKAQLKPVMVVHGSAAYGLLKNKFYKEKFGVENPNLDLLNKLHALDIPVILCGQTAGARDISVEKRWGKTQVALSAMTALIHYQNLDYALISL